MTSTTEKVTKEQVRLINEIWDTAELLSPMFSTDDLKDLILDEEGMKPDFALRNILYRLKKQHREPADIAAE